MLKTLHVTIFPLEMTSSNPEFLLWYNPTIATLKPLASIASDYKPPCKGNSNLAFEHYCRESLETFIQRHLVYLLNAFEFANDQRSPWFASTLA